MQTQTMTEPPPYFTDSCRHSLLYLGMTFVHKDDDLNKKINLKKMD